MVYLFKSQDIYKIGKAIDVQKRYETLLTGNPYLEIVCFGDGVKEKDIHNYFSGKRIKNEWFNLDEKDVLKAIDFITNKGSFSPKEKRDTKYNRFYKVTSNGIERYYKNLTQVSKNENLDYEPLYYSILRKNNLVYSKDGVLVELKQFE